MCLGEYCNHFCSHFPAFAVECICLLKAIGTLVDGDLSDASQASWNETSIKVSRMIDCLKHQTLQGSEDLSKHCW